MWLSMPKIAIRVSDALSRQLQAEAKQRSFDSASAFVRHAIQCELRQGESAVSQVEERIAATMNRLAKEVRALHTAQLATFALVDSLVKVFLTCVPEPPNDALDPAKARAKRRYEKFLVSVAQGMSRESRGALKELSRVDG
jgi:Arc/MetJ-type ribon-helix-helix transcriptional regulator